MNRYGKLVLLELQRFWKIYAALIAITLLSQFGGLYFALQGIMHRVEHRMKGAGLRSYAEYVDMFGAENFDNAVSQSEPWFTGPVLLCIAAMLFYVFFIWYRDWFGKNTFIYRLLMLPTERMNLYWAKLTAILAFVLGLVALQLVLFPLHLWLFGQMLPPDIGLAVSVSGFILHDQIFQILIPPTFLDFVLYYGTGVLGVAVVFTAILIERSYRLKGLVGGTLYAAAAGIAMLIPQSFRGFLYPIEIFWLMLGIGIALLGISLWISRLLLTRKITV